MTKYHGLDLITLTMFVTIVNLPEIPLFLSTFSTQKTKVKIGKIYDPENKRVSHTSHRCTMDVHFFFYFKGKTCTQKTCKTRYYYQIIKCIFYSDICHMK